MNIYVMNITMLWICFIIVQILYIEINNIGCSEIVITTISILTYDQCLIIQKLDEQAWNM